MKKNSNAGILYLVITIILFSSFEVVSKSTKGIVLPTQLTFIRFLIGGIFLLPFAIRDLKKRKLKLTKKNILWLFILGFLNVGISMNLAQYGIQMTKASLAAVLFSSNPLYVAVFSAFLLKERLSLKKIVGLLVGVVGVSIAMISGGGSGREFYLGSGLLILGAIVFSVYTVLGKQTTVELGSLTMTSVTFIFGCITMIPIFMAQGVKPWNFPFNEVWPQILYLSVLVSGIAYFLYFKALSMLDTSLGSMTFFVKPILASIFAAVVLGETLRVNLFVGSILVIVGITIVRKATVSAALNKSAKVNISLVSDK